MILNDFVFQWRHVLCGSYNRIVFRKFAYAIVRLSTLDFTIKEIDGPRAGLRGPLVRLQDLPSWHMWNDVIRVGGASIIICQHPPHARSLARADFKKWTAQRMKQYDSKPGTICRTYLLFSAHNVVLFQMDGNIERFTEPRCLFDSTSKMSSEAVDLLLQATQTSVSGSRLNTGFSIEVQDIILGYTAAGPLQRAVHGCKLNFGTAFNWRCDNRDIEREEFHRQRLHGTPVESQIWFNDCFSGLAYK